MASTSNSKPLYKNPVVITLVAILAVIAVVAVSLFVYVNNVRNTGIEKEAGLVAQYQDNQNELSTYILQFNESLGIADRNSERLNAVLVEALKGRYDGNLQEPGTGGALFSAISEAYPDLTSSAEQYAEVQRLIISGRNAYKNKQSVLLDRIRDYETWSEQGLFRSMVVNTLGFPSNRMEVRVGEQTFRGDDALDRMKTLVLTSEAIDAYETGEMDPLLNPNPEFGGSTPEPTP